MLGLRHYSETLNPDDNYNIRKRTLADNLQALLGQLLAGQGTCDLGYKLRLLLVRKLYLLWRIFSHFNLLWKYKC